MLFDIYLYTIVKTFSKCTHWCNHLIHNAIVCVFIFWIFSDLLGETGN